jgi:hypothetical protein
MKSNKHARINKTTEHVKQVKLHKTLASSNWYILSDDNDYDVKSAIFYSNKHGQFFLTETLMTVIKVTAIMMMMTKMT